MKTFFTYSFVLLALCCFGQEKDEKTHSPHKASVYSALLPGAGQVYNKKYWKVPIIYAGIGSAGYFVYDNSLKYTQYRDAYLFRKEGGTDEYMDVYTEGQLITIMEYYERNRDLSYIMAAAIYFLNIVDASVDAHLFDFDVSDDLSLHTSTKIMSTPMGYTPTLSLQMNF